MMLPGSLFLTASVCFPPSQPGMNGMEPAFGEAYGGHRGLLSPYPLAMSPQGGRTEYDQVRRYKPCFCFMMRILKGTVRFLDL